jgi:hypothetical protein
MSMHNLRPTRDSFGEKRRARAERAAADLAPVIADLRVNGVTSLRGIAKALNERRIPTVAGSGRWYHAQVRRVLKRLTGCPDRAAPFHARMGCGVVKQGVKAGCSRLSWDPRSQPRRQKLGLPDL